MTKLRYILPAVVAGIYLLLSFPVIFGSMQIGAIDGEPYPILMTLLNIPVIFVWTSMELPLEGYRLIIVLLSLILYGGAAALIGYILDAVLARTSDRTSTTAS